MTNPIENAQPTPITGKAALLASLAPVIDALIEAEPTGGRKLAKELDARFPLDAELMQHIRAQVILGLAEGWLCPREADGVAFGRLAKSGPETRGFSIDAVRMSGPGPAHVHPQGELDLCFALEGEPKFDGNPEGWTVYGPESWHIPTVRGGTMAILYFLPGGAIQFGPPPGR
jgi:hypothetical protein